MNKYLVALLSCASVTILSTAAKAQTDTGFSVDAEGYYYENKAPGISSFDGGFGRAGGSYTLEFLDTFWTVDAQAGLGVVNYSASGAGSLSGILDYNGELRLIATRDIVMSPTFIVSPFMGLGYRFLYDDASGKKTSDGQPAFDRQTQYFYWPIGLGFSFPMGDVTFKPSAEYDFLIDGDVTSVTSGLAGISNNIGNNVSHGSGFRATFDSEVQTPAGRLSFGPFVRYWSVRVSDLAPLNIGGQTIAFGFQPDNHTWEAGFGVKLNFGSSPAPARAIQPAPPAVPLPARPIAQAPEAQREFQVFFDFNKSDLTAAARQVIKAAARTAHTGTAVNLVVTGHTDTVGSAKYNQGLSERRATAVKNELVADGLPDSEITTLGVGKTGLLVPTADGVREAQNRRATIEVTSSAHY